MLKVRIIAIICLLILLQGYAYCFSFWSPVNFFSNLINTIVKVVETVIKGVVNLLSNLVSIVSNSISTSTAKQTNLSKSTNLVDQSEASKKSLQSSSSSQLGSSTATKLSSQNTNSVNENLSKSSAYISSSSSSSSRSSTGNIIVSDIVSTVNDGGTKIYQKINYSKLLELSDIFRYEIGEENPFKLMQFPQLNPLKISLSTNISPESFGIRGDLILPILAAISSLTIVRSSSLMKSSSSSSSNKENNDKTKAQASKSSYENPSLNLGRKIQEVFDWINKGLEDIREKVTAVANSVKDSIISYSKDLFNFYKDVFTKPKESLENAFSAIRGFGKTLAVGINNFFKDPLGSLNWVGNTIWEHKGEIVGGIIVGGAIAATIFTLGAAGFSIPPALAAAAAIGGGAVGVHYLSRKYGKDLIEIDEGIKNVGISCSSNFNELLLISPPIAAATCRVEVDDEEVRRKREVLERVGKNIVVDTSIALGSVAAGKLYENYMLWEANKDIMWKFEDKVVENPSNVIKEFKSSEAWKLFKRENFRLAIRDKEGKIVWSRFIFPRGESEKIESIIFQRRGEDFVLAVGKKGFSDGIKILEKNSLLVNVDSWNFVKANPRLIIHEFGDYQATIKGLTEATILKLSKEDLLNPRAVDIVNNRLFGDYYLIKNEGRAGAESWSKLVDNEIKSLVELVSENPEFRKDFLPDLAYYYLISEEGKKEVYLNLLRKSIESFSAEEEKAFSRYLEIFREGVKSWGY